MDHVVRLKELKASLPPDTPENVGVREELLVEARDLLLSLEQPDNVVERVCFQVLETVTISLAIKMGIFRTMKEDSSSSIGKLVEQTKSDRFLVERVMRTLASFGAVKQESATDFRLKTVSKTFRLSYNEAAIEHCLEFMTPGWLALPGYIKEINYQTPTKEKDSAFTRAYNMPGATVWEILSSTSHLPAFNMFVASFNRSHKDWLEFYPVEKRLGEGAESGSDAVMMVDVGGGLGHQTVNLKKRFPKLRGRLVVQDLPNVLPASKDRVPGIEYMDHDFTTEQPIKGARLYYLRYVMHDWPQDFVIELTKRIAAAMKPGYSRLVVHEWIVPEMGASKFMTAQDMNMMAMGGGMERTEALHRDYIDKAGLRVVKIYSPGDKISESVIEAEVA